MQGVQSIDPRTGEVRTVLGPETTRQEVDRLVERATSAARVFQQHDRSWRAGLLRALAAKLEAERDKIVHITDTETALGKERLNGELARTCFQLRMFADVVSEGAYVEATIDHAGPTGMGPCPDLRRMLVPIGPVAVFGASNFPLAFSVPGGDTASAIAAGCPVIVKAHESHSETSQLCAALLSEAAASVDAPDGTIAIVYGREAGAALVQHPGIMAVGFTGSVNGGRALMRLIDERPSPIPFYGELGSLNPVVVAAAAASERGEEVGSGLARSFTLGGGQFCTKPGLVFVPAGKSGDDVVRAAAAAIRDTPAPVLLNSHIYTSFGAGVDALKARIQVREVAVGHAADPGVHGRSAVLLEVDLSDLDESMFEEYFGPATLVARYSDRGSLAESLERLPASLTATFHIGASEGGVDPSVREALESRAGRVIYNGFPTGVAVAWAQNHGGGWPASNSLHTSVGPTAIRRFLRPVTWQNAPQSSIPMELRDETKGLPRRVDGVLVY